MLEEIKKAGDVKNVDEKSLDELCAEIRRKITETVAENGGHLASNLGIVELTVALHRAFNVPEDKIIFDVGHQSYTHKLLTGRADEFSTLRRKDGISGFTNRFESECDPLTAGHSGVSVSAGLGMATANKLSGSDAYVVAVVGDGSFTNGMIYEALNNCCDKKINFIIVLNDNEMSISTNVGNMANHFSKIRTSRPYFRFKRRLKKAFKKIPLAGGALINASAKVKNILKRIFVPNDGFFSAMGIRFLGPVDGHDIERLEDVFAEAKSYGECCLVLVKTKKGRGYEPAEKHPESYHSVGRLGLSGDESSKSGRTFSDIFGSIMEKRAESDGSLAVLTAAMCEGTGLLNFSKRFSDRFFDVGIAEEHEITFASGLAAAGMKSVCAIYSTFAQRVYDQVVHDVSIQRFGMTLAVDRAGFVPDDGITHQGLLDVALFSSIPGMVIYSPDSYEEMSKCFEKALDSGTLNVVRYPKGVEKAYDRTGFEYFDDGNIGVYGEKAPEVVLVTYGRIAEKAYAAAQMLKGKVKVKIIKLVKCYPINAEFLAKQTEGAKLLYLLEEGIRSGGIAEKTAAALCGIFKGRVLINAVDDTYAFHGTVRELYSHFKMSEEDIANQINDYFEREKQE